MFSRYLTYFLLSIFISQPIFVTANVNSELYRIRIRNTAGSLIQVSIDSGHSYSTVGRVSREANSRIIGFAAASYTPAGCIAATAVHGLRIKTGQSASGFGKKQMPLIFSITPAQFAAIPQGYGGHIPRSSAIQTDIYAGCSVFREFAPFVGNRVYTESSGELVPLEPDHIPKPGLAYVIIVTRPNDTPISIEFENRESGSVTARYADGSSRKIAEVVRPVTGVGRYDATTFTGVGAINTNHGGVITISTAPVKPPATVEGCEPETRGGFMIQPDRHANEQGEKKGQVMVVKPLDGLAMLEGSPPMFNSYIGLLWDPTQPDKSYKAQIRLDGCDWEEMPVVVGKIDNAFSSEYLSEYVYPKRIIVKGVTHIRIALPETDRNYLSKKLAGYAATFNGKTGSDIKKISGVYMVTTDICNSFVEMVDFFVDGVKQFSTGSAPYRLQWNTTKHANGFHELETEVRSKNGDVSATRSIVYINN